jgi:hypothetical protein
MNEIILTFRQYAVLVLATSNRNPGTSGTAGLNISAQNASTECRYFLDHCVARKVEGVR